MIPPSGGTEHLAKLTLNFFAEFLEPFLPVYLGILYQSTCVGLSTDYHLTPYLNFPGDLSRSNYLTCVKLTLITRLNLR